MTFYWRDSPARLPVHVRENLLFSGVPTVRAMQNGLLHHNIPSAVRLAVALNDRLGKVRTADPSHLSFRSPFLAIVRVSTHRLLSSWANFEVHSWYFVLHPVLLCRKSTYLQLILVGVTPRDRPTGTLRILSTTTHNVMTPQLLALSSRSVSQFPTCPSGNSVSPRPL